MIHLLLVFIFALHLMCVGLAGMGPLVSMWLHWRGLRGDEQAWRLGRRLAGDCIAALAVGIVLGGVTLGLLWMLEPTESNRYFRALVRIRPSRLWFGGIELVFYFACMAVYWGLWEKLRRWPWLHRFVAVLAVTDLLYHFPPLFAVVAVLTHDAGTVADVPARLSNREFLSVMTSTQALARVTHHLLAAATVTGVYVMLLGLREARPAQAAVGDKESALPAGGAAAEAGEQAEQDVPTIEPASAARVVRWGGRIALVPALLQLPSGVFVTVTLPALQQQQVLGGDWVATGLLALGVLAAFGLLHTLAAAAIGDVGRRDVRRTAGLLFAVILLMVSARHRSRPALSPSVAQAAARASQRQTPPATHELHREDGTWNRN